MKSGNNQIHKIIMQKNIASSDKKSISPRDRHSSMEIIRGRSSIRDMLLAEMRGKLPIPINIDYNGSGAFRGFHNLGFYHNPVFCSTGKRR